MTDLDLIDQDLERMEDHWQGYELARNEMPGLVAELRKAREAIKAADEMFAAEKAWLDTCNDDDEHGEHNEGYVIARNKYLEARALLDVPGNP